MYSDYLFFTEIAGTTLLTNSKKKMAPPLDIISAFYLFCNEIISQYVSQVRLSPFE